MKHVLCKLVFFRVGFWEFFSEDVSCPLLLSHLDWKYIWTVCIALEFCCEAEAHVRAELPAAHTSLFTLESSCNTSWTSRSTGDWENLSIISWASRQKAIVFKKKVLTRLLIFLSNDNLPN